jgi:AcrR family transcriptional regulator
MGDDAKAIWVQHAYRLFAEGGPAALTVEGLAREVGKSKSSFYHHFSDMGIFQDALLAYHLDRAKLIAERERACKSVDPELFDVLVAFKEDLLFNRQLRIHRSVPAYCACCQKASAYTGEAILGIWAEALGLSHNAHLANLVLALSLQNFFIQVNEETLNHDWLRAYVNEHKAMVRAFSDNNKFGQVLS